MVYMGNMKDTIRKYIEIQINKERNKKLLPLMRPSFGIEEIEEAINCLCSLNLTMGKNVARFENAFSRYIDIKYSTMVNSGSSANLLGLSILSNPAIKNPIKPGDEIIVPSVTWSTTIYPIINIGAKPVLVDVNEDYLIDIEQIKENITPKTRAIIPVHLLGNVCDMKDINEIAQDNKLYIMEDCCESLGSEYNGKKVGNFSDISTYSFYFSHHISTIEGGMICTNNFEYADLSRILRAHGYVRNSFKMKEHIKANPNIDPRFLFINLGYNFRPTEIQGVFGIQQLKKLEQFIIKRNEIGMELTSRLKKYEDYIGLPRIKNNTRHSWFSYPIMVKNDKLFSKNELTSFLEMNGIETRPIVGGNFAAQPIFKLFKYKKGRLTNSENIMRNGFYFGIHPDITNQEINDIIQVFEKFFNNR